ncbi:hypothetical protein BH24CHL4_BH24CHL4_08270 [soil metagenome]
MAGNELVLRPRACRAARTEAVTTLTDGEVPDDVFERAGAEFGERTLSDLTLLVITINGWNRIAIPYQVEPAPFEAAQNQAATGVRAVQVK